MFKFYKIRRQRHIILFIISIICFSILEQGCHSNHKGATSKDRARLDSLFTIASDAARKDRFSVSDSLGMILYKEAREKGDKVYEAYGLLARGFYPKTSEGCEKRLPLVKEAEKIALTTDNDTLLSWVYNVLGIYSTVYECNFSQARHYYAEAIKYAKRINATNFILSAECNIAELYHSIGDTLGHIYDLDIYKYAKQKDNKALLLPSAQRCAEYYVERVNLPNRSLPYIESVKDAGSDYLYHLLLGKYYLKLDSLPKARLELDKALNQEIISPSVYLTYGKLLNLSADYAGSNKYLKMAEEAYHEVDSKGFNHIEIWRIMSDNYRHLGEDRNAFKYLELFINGRDSVNRLRNQEEINTYKVRFDVEKKELELARNRETMRRQSISLWASIGIILLAGGFYLFYTLRKRSMHRLIVRQHKDFLREQETIPASSPTTSMEATIRVEEKQATDASVMQKENADENQNGLSDEKANEIWKLIMHEMDVNKIYTDTTVTRDKFSERVGCNHTWFSQVIKLRTGKSYLQFMNSKRIKEALRILSDPSSDLTQKELAAKLGFLSPSTFYSAFRQQVGMSPAEYRKLALTEGNNEKISADEY